MDEKESEYRENDFKTIDITRITPMDRVLSMVRKPQRPGNACKMTSGFIHSDEVPQIAKVLGVTEEQLKENLLEKRYAYNKHVHKPRLVKHKKKEHYPYGKCVFLDDSQGEQKCQLGDARPLHCRLSTDESHGFKLHIWYVLNYLVDRDDPEAIREWAIYLKTHPTIPGGELDELVPEGDRRDKILDHQI